VTSVARPQAVKSREAILRAVTELIATEGAGAVTHQRAAEKAGVGRATVYRHWPQLSDLLNDALARTTLQFLPPAPGTLLERVEAELHRVARDLNTVPVTALAATVLDRAQFDEDTRHLRDRLVTAIHDNITDAVQQALTTGELRAAPATDNLFDQLLGPLFARRLFSGKPITDDLIHRVTADTLGPWLGKGRRSMGQGLSGDEVISAESD
jgi:AcrR family transcriptional regulator